MFLATDTLISTYFTDRLIVIREKSVFIRASVAFSCMVQNLLSQCLRIKRVISLSDKPDETSEPKWSSSVVTRLVIFAHPNK